MEGLGKLLIVVGLLVAAIGVLLALGIKIPWLGRLPGDTMIEKENFRLYLPLGTCLLLSALLTLILYLFRK